MIYTIEVLKHEVQYASIEGDTLREALQKIADDEELDWQYADGSLSYEITGILDEPYDDPYTDKQRRKLVKKARKIWKEIG